MRILTTLIIFVCLLSPAIAQHSITGVVTDTKNATMPSATVVLRNASDSSQMLGTASNANGAFEIKNVPSGAYMLHISAVGFEQFSAPLQVESDINVGTIVLKEKAHTIDEVVVTAEMIKQFGDRTEYRMTNTDKQRYSSALAALEHVPQLQVMDQNVQSISGKAIKILINGMPASAQDLATLPAGEIIKMEHYDNPPIKFQNMGLGAVVNVITKRDVGGSIGINTQNAVTTGFGNNIISLRYNSGAMQVGASYNINYRNFNHRRLDEQFDYKAGTKQISTERTGLNSPTGYEEQMGELQLNAIKPNSYTFSTKLSLKSLNRRQYAAQNISQKIDTTVNKSGQSVDKNKYIRPVLDVYFDKRFAQRHSIAINAVATYYKSDYNYTYNEWLSDQTPVFGTSTGIDMDKYSAIGDAVYSLQTRVGEIFVGSRYMHSSSQQNNISENNTLMSNELYSYVGMGGMLSKQINYSVSAGVNYSVFGNYSSLYFRPQVRIAYMFSPASSLNFNYEVNTQTPAISELTYNPYLKDIGYIYVGNPALKSSHSHNLSMLYIKMSPKFSFNSEISFRHTPNAIAPVFTSDSANLIETIANLSRSQTYKANLFAQWIPLQNPMLRLRTFVEVQRTQNAYAGENWGLWDVVNISTIMLNYKKWGAQVFYQTSRRTLVGQTTTMVPSMASVELSYRPVQNLTLSACVRYPFYKSYQMTTEIVGSRLIERTNVEHIDNLANMVYFNLVYNFAFGQKYSNGKPKMQNEDKDSGVLERK